MKNTFTMLLRSLAVAALCSAGAHAQTYQQVWSDEFDGSAVKTSNWKFETGGGGWGNNEKQYYQASNATVVDGELRITAKQQSMGGMPYTSARMVTLGLKDFTYGKVEARIKLPLGQGLWPAFWMLGSNINSVSWPKCGEIDILEQINTDSRTYGTAHWANASGQHVQYGGNKATTAGEYHVYGIEWDASAIRWMLDGVQYHIMSIANGTGSTEEFQRPFFIILNMAVAGDWPGQSVDLSKLPATMSVDYVRVYQKVTATGTAKSSAGQLLDVYPNPATNKLSLKSGASLDGSTYRILNTTGQRVASGSAASGTLDVAALPAGVYTLLVTTKDQQTITRRFTK